MKDSYYSNDRTFCANSNCKETQCEMNQSHIRFPAREISLADYSVTEVCVLNKNKEK